MPRRSSNASKREAMLDVPALGARTLHLRDGDAMKGRYFDHALGQVDSTNSTVRDNAARPIPLLAWTAMPLLKATM